MPVGNFIDNVCYEPSHLAPASGDARPDASLNVGARTLLVSRECTAYEPAQLAHRSESGPVGPSRLVRSSTASVQKRDAWRAGVNDCKKGAELLADITLKRQKNEWASTLTGRMKGGAGGALTGPQAPGYDVVGRPVSVVPAYSVVAVDQLNFSEANIERLEREIQAAQGRLGGDPPAIAPLNHEYEVAEHAHELTPDPDYEALEEPLYYTIDESPSVSEREEPSLASVPENEAFYNHPADLEGSLLKLLEVGRDKRHAFISG